VYIEEAKYQLRDDEIFNLRAMHQQEGMQNIQGHILGNKIKLSSSNNWTKMNDDGSGFKYDEDGFRMYLPKEFIIFEIYRFIFIDMRAVIQNN